MVQSESLKKLQEYANKEFVFHGSPEEHIERFEPRVADDTDKSNTFNNDTAVFLAVDPVAAIAFALIDTWDKRWPEPKEWTVGPRERYSSKVYIDLPIETKDMFKNSKGYVYVFKRTDELETGGSSWQLKSKSHLTPIDKIEVIFSDLEFFDDRITWI